MSANEEKKQEIGELALAIRAFEVFVNDSISYTDRAVFNRICQHRGITNKSIAERLKLQPEQVSRAVKKLLDLGWITYKDDESDRRIKKFGATPLGVDEMKRIMSIIHGRPVDVVKGIEFWNNVREK